ncbi:unnamed protein product [Ectocarpus fasciculatus]
MYIHRSTAADGENSSNIPHQAPTYSYFFEKQARWPLFTTTTSHATFLVSGFVLLYIMRKQTKNAFEPRISILLGSAMTTTTKTNQSDHESVLRHTYTRGPSPVPNTRARSTLL